MIKNLKKFFNTASVLVMGSFLLLNCEPEIDQLGSQLFTGAEGVDEAFPLIAYTHLYKNGIRSDFGDLDLDSAVIGAFNENQFGLQKANYYTQIRLTSYDPDFGDNPVLDSAVLTIKPLYETDSATTSTYEDYVYPVGSVPAKKVVNTYPVRKFGKYKIGGATAPMHILVNEVTDFMGSVADSLQSTKGFAAGTVLANYPFNGNITSVAVTKDSDASAITEVSRDASIRIKLDSTFITNKILAKEDSPELADAASFIRHFKGLKISVAEDDGYLMQIKASDVAITLYYKKDVTTNGTTAKEAATLALNLSSTANVKQGQTIYNRSGSALGTAELAIDSINGNRKVFAQGMGGPGIGLRIPAEAISDLKTKFQNEKIGIIAAKLRIYTDPEAGLDSYRKSNYLTLRQKDLNTFITEFNSIFYSGFYTFVKRNSDPSYYDISIIETLKDIVENEGQNKDFIVDLGEYTVNSSGAFVGLSYTNQQMYNKRVYTPFRTVFVGTVMSESDPLYAKGAKLLISYGKK